MELLQLIKYEEGYRSNPYYCSEGYPTVGIGKKIGPKGAPLEMYGFTVSESIALQWLNEEVELAASSLIKLEWFKSCSPDIRVILVSMAYQMGVSGLLKFKKMIKAIECEDWLLASSEAKDSRWHKQTQKRATRHCRVLAGESILDVYGA